MSDKEQTDLWAQMDADLERVLADDTALAAHGAISRDALEAHMRDEHGIVASSRLTLEPIPDDPRVRVGHQVTPLDEIGESQLRAGHWRLHELGKEHRQ